jgi:hypothetical protein
MLLKPYMLVGATLMIPPPHDTLPDLAIGDGLPAGDVQMLNIHEKNVTLASLKGEKGLLVIFSCNTCPFVVGSDGSEGWEGRYSALSSLANEKGIGMVLVNSNEAKREAGDGMKDMQERFRSKGYRCEYVLDAGHKVADAFGARTTPHVFLFDKDLKLVYKGAIDDNVDSAAAAKAHYLKDAMMNLSIGRPIEPAITRNIGCSIKRVQTPHAH